MKKDKQYKGEIIIYQTSKKEVGLTYSILEHVVAKTAITQEHRAKIAQWHNVHFYGILLS